jgi:hypothetical protein
VPGLFDNLIQRHRHVLNLPATQPQLKSEARVLLFGMMARRQAVGRACGVCSVACATCGAGSLKSHRSLKPGSSSRPMSLAHRSPKLTLTEFDAGHGSVTLLPKHDHPEGGRFHVPSVVTSWCGGPCAGNVTCPEGCSKFLGRSESLRPFRPAGASPCRPISLARTASGGNMTFCWTDPCQSLACAQKRRT